MYIITESRNLILKGILCLDGAVKVWERGQFAQASSIASDQEGFIYVIDNSDSFKPHPNDSHHLPTIATGRLQKFDSNGNFIKQCYPDVYFITGITINPMGYIFLAARVINPINILYFVTC